MQLSLLIDNHGKSNMPKYKFKLYIIGYTLLARKAIKNLELICESPALRDLYKLEIINLEEHPDLADSENIIATPLLIKEFPKPICRVIGDLSDRDQVLTGLDIHEIKAQ